jgi:hypothetical protein
MTTNRVTAADWALMTKNPGDKADYRILFGSSPGLASRVRTGVPSTPELGSAPGPGRLPWATFTPRYPDGQFRIAVTAIDATSETDAAGRRLAEFRYVELPFVDVADAGAGYVALYQAVPARPALADRRLDREKLTMELPGPGGAVTRSLDDAGCFDRAAGVAALLLCGDVLLTLDERPGRDSLPLADRLAEFDRVLALLPFGMRAGVALGSWDDATQKTSFRLAFGKHATLGQAVARYGEPVPLPDDDRAVRYLRYLRQLRRRVGIERLVAHLGQFRAPLRADDADYATEILSSLDDPMVVVQAARDGLPSVELVANTWVHAADRIDGYARDELEAYLLNQPDEEAERAVNDGWSDRTPRIAARVALSELRTGHGSKVRPLHDRAERHGDQDSFLAALAAGETHRGEPVKTRVVAEELRSLVAPRCGELPVLRRAAHERPDLVRWLLRLSLDRDADPRAWLDWLDPLAADTPAWLAGYAVLTATPGVPVQIPAGSQEVTAQAEDLALAVWLAVRDNSFSALTRQWWPPLLRLARTRAVPLASDDPAGPAIGQACADLASLLGQSEARRMAAADLTVAALVDTLRLYLGLKPVYYPLDAGAGTCRAYLDALWSAWSQPPTEDDASALAVRLLDGVFGAEPHGQSPVSAYREAMITLIYEVVTDDRVPLDDAVAGRIGRVIDASPGLVDESRLTPQWWDRVERVLPGLRTPQARLRAAVSRVSRAPTSREQVEIAVLCASAAASDPVPEVAAIVKPWFAGQSAAVRASMFRIIEGALRLAGLESDRSFDDYIVALASDLGLGEERQGVLRRRRTPQP